MLQSLSEVPSSMLAMLMTLVTSKSRAWLKTEAPKSISFMSVTRLVSKLSG